MKIYIENLNDSEDEFISHFQKIMILRVIQQIFCEILIGGRTIIYNDSFFESTNIMKNVQNDSSRFEGSLHEMVSKKPFMNQEISYMNGNGEMKLSTLYAYTKEFLSIIEIEKKKVSHML